MPKRLTIIFFRFYVLSTLCIVSACSLLDPKTSTTDTESSLKLPNSDDLENAIVEHPTLEEKIAEQVSHPVVYTDVWERIRNGYQLPSVENPQIAAHLTWYTHNQAHIDRFTERSQRYLHYVVSEMEANNMPLELALLPIIESSYDPFAYSRSKAAGIWQFVPGTGRNFGLKQDWWYDGRRDIVASTDAAIRYLQRLHAMFDGDWLLALAAYNAGEGRVGRAVRKNQKEGKPTDFWSLTLPKETRSYVPRLLALSKIIAQPDLYQITLNSIPNNPYFATINLDSQIDMMQAAKLAEIDLQELQHLNAGYNRWLTAPSGSHHLLVPVAHAENFTTQLSNLPKLAPISWSEHKVAKGDVLGSIARKYKTTVDAIRSVNQLKGNTIRVGQTLLVPSASVNLPAYASSADLMQNYGKSTNSNAQYHVVRAGDSLWKIAKRYNTNVASITRLNNINTKKPLKLGQKLHVSKTSNITIDKNYVAENGTHKMLYQIQRGDTLHSIANRFKLSTKDIMNWNAVKDVRYIHPGQSLTLFVSADHVN